MTINYWLYADPDDGPSIDIIDIVKTQFPQVILCEDFDQLQLNVNNNQQHVVLIIQPINGSTSKTLPYHVWHQRIRELASKSVQCVWFITEIYELAQCNEWACTFSNLLIVAPGQHDFNKNYYSWVTWHHWVQDAVSVYKHPTMQNYISAFDPKSIKPQLFDVLLGGTRPYRTLLHDWIEQDSVLSPQTIMTYYGGKTSRPSEILEPGMMISVPVKHFSVACNFQGVRTRAGVIPPVSVYQQTAYSVVTETTAQHNYVFYTEKIARVIVCQRLFIVLSSYKYLHYLRESGFKTFGSIINESYDLEVDDVRRWRMAFEQMQQLAKMDQHWVLEQMHPIVEHNLQVLMHTDWHKKMSNDVNQVVNSRLQLDLEKA